MATPAASAASSTPKKILLLGATGPSGLVALQYALSRGHIITCYCRSPNKLSHINHPYLRIIKGTLDPSDAPKMAEACAGQDIVISLLGPSSSEISAWMVPWRHPDTFFADCYRTSIIPAMRTHGIKRILAMGTVSIVEPEDIRSWVRSVCVTFVYLFVHSAYRNIIEIGKYFDRVNDGVAEREKVDWTVFRLGMISGGEAEQVASGYIADGETTMGVRRSEIAEWLVGQVEEMGEGGPVAGGKGKWVGRKPVISSSKVRGKTKRN